MYIYQEITACYTECLNTNKSFVDEFSILFYVDWSCFLKITYIEIDF